MEIQIEKSQCLSIASSISSYLFREIHALDEEEMDMHLMMGWITGITAFYKEILEAYEDSESDEGYITVHVDESLGMDVVSLIREYLVSEIKDMVEDDMEWLVAITSMHEQITEKCREEKQARKRQSDGNASLEERDIMYGRER